MSEASAGQIALGSIGGNANRELPPQEQAILVLGMHRGGTSAIGGVLSLLGVAGPKTPPEPDNWNPRGYFESKLFFRALDELLASVDSAWNDWRPLDPQSLVGDPAEQHRCKIRSLLTDEFSDQSLIFIKDPRLCRLVPYLSSMLKELNRAPMAVVPIRNPLEVARSLQRRDQLPFSASMLVWLRHMLDAEFFSRQMPRCFVRYEDLVNNWRPEMDRVAKQLGIAWPDRSESSGIAVDQFLTKDLHRERVALGEFRSSADVPPLVRDTYAILASFAANGEISEKGDRLDELRTRFDHGCEIFAAAMAADHTAVETLRGELAKQTARADELHRNSDMFAATHAVLRAERDKLAATHGELTAEYERLVDSHHKLVAERDAILASRSWRWAAPLRFLRELLGGLGRNG